VVTATQPQVSDYIGISWVDKQFSSEVAGPNGEKYTHSVGDDGWKEMLAPAS
jgi:hypothetical protein